MLSIGKLGAGQERYYLDKVARGAEDYYSGEGEGEAEGYWLGDAATNLGLQGKVDPDQLTAMLTGNDPITGEPLGLRYVAGRGPVPGFDLTFSAPKSVSLAWALGGHPVAAEVKAAHEASVAAALDYLQRQACWTRRGKGGHEFVPGNGFLAAAYRHRSSRAGDPQLHTHVLIANATHGPDGRWTRLYHPAIYEHAKTAGYIYEASLRHELTRGLAVGWGEVKNGIAEIAGISEAHRRAFSTRRGEILDATGPDASMRARRIATLETRKAKERNLSAESLRERWRAKGEEIGLDRERIGRALGWPRPGDVLLTAAEVERELTAHASHFDRRDAIQAIAQLQTYGAPAREIEALADAFLASAEVISIGRSPKGERFTTRRIWELEQRALAVAQEMASTGGHGLADEVTVARVLSARPSIKPEQREMVRRLLAGGEGLAIVVGEAGTGKTYALCAAAFGWAASSTIGGLRVAAPTWRAANALRSEGLQATSVARLLAELERAEGKGWGGLRTGSVLVVDEAGMVDSATLARLIHHAEAAKAKLVLIGDPAQLGEIEAGGLFAALVERTEPIHLGEVIRHNHDLDREGAKRIREGEGREALSLYRAEDRVIVAADPDTRREEMVRDWWQSYSRGEDAVMVAKRNAEVERLNVLARALMRAEGRLGSVEIEVGGHAFAVGDQVITRINDHRARIYNRERWRVTEVYADARGVVLDGIDTARRVSVDAVYLGRVGERDGAPALQHAYAATTYQAQGSTVDRAYVMVDPSMDRQEFYVAASRSREETYFYATPEIQLEREEYAPRSPHLREGLEHIAEAAERDGRQLAAHDEALRLRLAERSVPELRTRREKIEGQLAEGDPVRLAKLIKHLEHSLRDAEQGLARPDRLGLPRLEELRNLRERALTQLTEVRRQLAEAPGPQQRQALAAELAATEHLLAERERLALTAIRISPPPYIAQELGERPSDPAKAASWDEAVRSIERYRERHGIGDRDTALGPRLQGTSARAERVAVQRAIERSTGRSLERSREWVIERSI